MNLNEAQEAFDYWDEVLRIIQKKKDANATTYNDNFEQKTEANENETTQTEVDNENRQEPDNNNIVAESNADNATEQADDTGAGNETSTRGSIENDTEQEIKPIGKGDFGNIYDQFKHNAQKAIAFLKEKQSGEAIGALYHKDIGDIDLVWGEAGTAQSDGYGLAKLVKYHPEVLDNLQEILNGMHITEKTDNRIQLESEKHKAAVRLTWNEQRKTWLLTAFEKRNSVSNNTTDTARTQKGKNNDTTTIQNTVSNGKDTTKNDTDKEKEERSSLNATPNATKGKRVDEVSNGHIDDFGEKIGGARKDLAQKLADIKDDDILKQPLSKIFPRLDFKKLVESGVLSVDNALYLKYRYDNMETKPRNATKLRLWIPKVKKEIEITQQVIAQNDNWNYLDRLKERILALNGGATELSQEQKLMLNTAYLEIKTLKALGFPMTDVKLGNTKIRYSVRNGEDFSVTINGRTSHFETFNDAVDFIAKELKTPKETVFNIYRNNKSNTYFIGKDIQGKSPIHLSETFDNRDDAKEYLRNHRDEIQRKWDALNANTEERRRENRERTGKDWRNGKDVSPEQFQQKFKFRGVEFGNWVNQKERQKALNDAYDALMDLSSALNISPSALSLNGGLALAFGARGHGAGRGTAAAAHYETEKVVINLTKKSGAGSLAHEWWHALDNYFAKMGGKTNAYSTEGTRTLNDNVRQEMKQVFDDITNIIKNTDISKRSKDLDKVRSKSYWSNITEMTARSFESYVNTILADKGIINDYLVNYKEQEDWNGGAESYPYPTKDEASAINEKFQQFFDTIREKTGENGNIALYQQSDKEYKSVTRKVFDKILERLNKSGLLKNGKAYVLSQEDFMQKVRNGYSQRGQENVWWDKDGNIYGFVDKNGDIYFNEALLNTNTPIHEYGHLWNNFIKQTDNKRYEEGCNLIKKTKYYDEVKKAAQDEDSVYYGINEDAILDEALARAIGDRGERIINLPKRFRFKLWLSNLWSSIKKSLGIKEKINGKETWQEFADKAAKELLSRQDITKKESQDTPQTEIEKGKVSDEAKKKVAKRLANFLEKSLGIDISTDTKEAQKVLEERGNPLQFFSTSAGEVYGFFDPQTNKIYLDPEVLNARTVLHETTHLIDKIVRKVNPEYWTKGVELLKETPLWQEIVDNPAYSNIKNDDNLIASEVMARLVGERGEKMLNELSNEGKTTIEKWNAKTLVGKIKNWIKGYWQHVKSIFTRWGYDEVKNLTLDDMINSRLDAIFSGEKLPQLNAAEREEIERKAKADGEILLNDATSLGTSVGNVVKSATDNIGTFDEGDNNILFEAEDNRTTEEQHQQHKVTIEEIHKKPKDRCCRGDLLMRRKKEENLTLIKYYNILIK